MYVYIDIEMQKIHGLIGLFLMLVVIIAVSPRFINNIYDTILGRIVLLGVVIFFTAHNTTLGLLVALCLIVVSNKYLIEGIENMEPNAEDVKKPEGSNTEDVKKPEEQKTEDVKKPEDKKEVKPEDTKTSGPIALNEAIQPVDSSAIPVSKDDFKSDDVKPVTSKDGFSLMYSEL
jgi:hypothetical protein